MATPKPSNCAQTFPHAQAEAAACAPDARGPISAASDAMPLLFVTVVVASAAKPEFRVQCTA